MTGKEKLVHKIRSGAIEFAVWLNSSESGPFYSVTMSRSYKQGEEWRQANSFGADDLLLVANLLVQAHSWITANPARQAG